MGVWKRKTVVGEGQAMTNLKTKFCSINGRKIREIVALVNAMFNISIRESKKFCVTKMFYNNGKKDETKFPSHHLPPLRTSKLPQKEIGS